MHIYEHGIFPYDLPAHSLYTFTTLPLLCEISRFGLPLPIFPLAVWYVLSACIPCYPHCWDPSFTSLWPLTPHRLFHTFLTHICMHITPFWASLHFTLQFAFSILHFLFLFAFYFYILFHILFWPSHPYDLIWPSHLRFTCFCILFTHFHIFSHICLI